MTGQHERRFRSALVALAACLLWLAADASASGEPRRKISLNAGWSFSLDAPPGEPAPATWQSVDLPHSWNAADGRDKRKPYHRGIGRYRKSLFIEPSLLAGPLFLYFEGANQAAEVTVNSKPAGRHVGGYSAFAFEISDLVRFGEANEIEVTVDNRHSDDIPPLNADFTFYGGIYRDTWLLSLNDVHFDIDEYAATDVRIATPSISENRASIEVDAGIANSSASGREVQVDTSVVDADGSVIEQASVAATLETHEVTDLRLARFEIDEPKLWSPESPYLYRVICTIREGNRVLDRLDYPLGLRWIEVDAQSGFRLNGKPYRLYGTNRHQDYPGLGNALPNEIHRSDLLKIKDNGFNFLRLAHYPQDPEVLATADEIGLFVWEETPVVNLVGLSARFRESSARMVREMVRQHRHHPSIIFWGYMNEVTLFEPDPLPPNYYEEVVALARHLDGVVREEDPVRPTVMAISRDEIANGVPLASVPDILALNLYFGWYYGELDDLGRFLDRYHRENPELPLFVSEYGAGSDRRVHSLSPGRFDFSTEYQQRFHETAFRQILERPWLIGSAVWAQFDFGSNHRQDTIFGINQKGLWYYDRRPKDVASFYRAHLATEPVLHIAARDWTRRAGSRPEDATLPVSVYSNEPSVELFANGVSLGSKPVQNATATWNVEFTHGENILLVRAGALEDEAVVAYEERGALFSKNAPRGASVAVSAGANEQYVDGDGRIWEADRAYAAGSWGHTGGSAERSHHRIFDTGDDPLYQTRRSGAHSYRFDVPDGSYLLGLRFAALDDTSRNTDAFSVEVNGLTRSITGLLPYTRRDFSFPVEVSGGKGVELRFASDPATAFVNGIILERR